MLLLTKKCKGVLWWPTQEREIPANKRKDAVWSNDLSV